MTDFLKPSFAVAFAMRNSQPLPVTFQNSSS